MRYLLFALTLLCLTACNRAPQKTTLVFHTQGETTVRIHKPIDGIPNHWYVHHRLELMPNSTTNYEFEMNDFGFVRLQFSCGLWEDILVFPGDHIEITYAPQRITMAGSNAEGHNYNHMRACRRKGIPLHFFYTDPSRVEYDSIFKHTIQRISRNRAELNRMKISGQITAEFAKVMGESLHFYHTFRLGSIYFGLLRNARLASTGVIFNREFIPSKKDIQTMMSQLEKLHDRPWARSGDAARLPFYFGDIYVTRYLALDDDARKQLLEGHDRETFGRDRPFLMAPDKVQLRIFGNRFLENLLLGMNHRFDTEKLLTFLNDNFPDSEHVAIIKRLIAEKEKPIEVNDEIVFVDNSPTSLNELVQLQEIKGNYIYVSLWASWCAPCIVEFGFNEEVRRLLTEFNNVVPVYISIDNNEERWKNAIARHSPKGYHILASELLRKDIATRIYNAERIGSIPRSFLIDPQGNILNDNLPRSSRTTELRLAFEELLKK